MKGLVGTLGLIVVIPCLALGQCRCERGICSTECPMGERTFGFTIPIASITSVLSLLEWIQPLRPGVTLLLPNVRVLLGADFFGVASTLCPSNCCHPFRPLWMGADLFLVGSAKLDSIPPTSVSFSSPVSIVVGVLDQSEQDIDRAVCGIARRWSYREKFTQVTLTWALGFGFVDLPLVDTKATGMAECEVYCGCRGFNGPPQILSFPGEVVVPLGQEVEFAVEAWDVDGDPLWFRAVSERSTIDFREVQVLGVGKVRAIGFIKAPLELLDAHHETVETVLLSVRDRGWREPEGLADSKEMVIRYVRNQPPRAISDGTTLSHGQSSPASIR